MLTMLDAIWVPAVAIGDLLTRPWCGQSPELWKRARRASRFAAVGIAAVTVAAVGAWLIANPVASAAVNMLAALAIMATAISALSKQRAWWIFGAALAVVAAVGLYVPAVYLGKLAWGAAPARPNLEQPAINFISFSLLLYAMALWGLRQGAEY